MTFDDAVKAFAYEKQTGELFWKYDASPNVRAGNKAGTACPRGYVSISFNKRLYKAHRVVWLLHHGQWPKKGIDHINGNTSDNRIENLREADNRDNCLNKRRHRDGHLPGVAFINAANLWVARIRFGGDRISLGCFDDKVKAHVAYKSAHSWVRMHEAFSRS